MVYRASSKCQVVDESFPAKFFEKNPNKIFESYCKFIKNRSNAEGDLRNEDKLAFTTISERFANNEYSADQGGYYKLYHDIKLVCTMLVHFYPQGTRNYQMVDKFYKFATELLLRECYRIGVSFVESEVDKSKDTASTELDKIIAKDFIKISTSYQVPISQTYHIKTRELELFSSTIAKSSLDSRPKELPNSNFEINKIVPQTNLFEEAPRLGFVAANTSNIPDPTLPPTEILTRFLHPNWYSLPTTVWLKYGDYKSWAPAFNENGSVLDSTSRGIIWLERIGYSELLSTKEADEEKKEEQNGKDMEEGKQEEAQQKEKVGTSLKKQENSKEEIQDDIASNGTTAVEKEVVNLNGVGLKASSDAKPIIKLENLFEWSPQNYIGDDEVKAFEEGTQDKLINSTLLKIQKLRKSRVTENKVLKPSKEETELYYKARRLIKEVVLSKQISKLPMNHCRSFPVLQTNYNGSIPVVRSQYTKKRKAKR